MWNHTVRRCREAIFWAKGKWVISQLARGRMWQGQFRSYKELQLSALPQPFNEKGPGYMFSLARRGEPYRQKYPKIIDLCVSLTIVDLTELWFSGCTVSPHLLPWQQASEYQPYVHWVQAGLTDINNQDYGSKQTQNCKNNGGIQLP